MRLYRRAVPDDGSSSRDADADAAVGREREAPTGSLASVMRVEGPEGRPAVPLPFALTVGLFVFSGATGLVDQLCFSKYLAYVVGATAYAVSAVLAAFMTGLALGAHLGGKWSARVRRPLVAYAALELLVAAAVAVTPFGFEALAPIYASLAREAPGSLVALSALRWVVALVLVVVPTTAMGATLPLLSRGIEAADFGKPRERERRVTTLYAANTFGGAVGALAAAYLIVPALGLSRTLFASALASAVIALVAAWTGRRVTVERAPVGPSSEVSEQAPEVSSSGAIAPSRRDRTLLRTLAFASGALVFACEVVFTHLLALIIGNSAYAFGLILAAFLTSLFVGATLAGRLREKLADGALSLSLALTAVALLVTLPVWDDLPTLFAGLGETVTSFEGREAARGVTALVVVFLPTCFMGLTFPLLLQRVASYSGVGGWVGRLTAINTLGAVFGSLVTGYVVLPSLGSQGSVVAIGVGFALSAVLATLFWATGALRKTSLGLAAVAVVAGFAAPRWSLEDLTSGSNVYFEAPKNTQRLVSIREDVHGGVTTVALADGVYTLFTNGKFQGNTGWEMNAQRFFAHYPSIFVERFDEALVIGLGTGTTVGTLAAYPWKALRVVEISPSIVDAAKRYFSVPNRGALSDPRVELILGDGRNHVLLETRRYDLISMELTSVWFAGASNLYSKEFYELIRERLDKNGIFQQWVQLHHIYKKDFTAIVNTLCHVFPHVALFYGGGQGILVASMEPLRASRARLANLESRASVRAVEPFARPLEALLEDVLVSDAGLRKFLTSSAREAGEPVDELISTDDNLYLEYQTPRGNVLPWDARELLVAELRRYRDPDAIRALLGP